MNRRGSLGGSGVGRADLLRAFAAAGTDPQARRRLAEAMDFGVEVRASQVSGNWPGISGAAQATADAPAAAPQNPAPLTLPLSPPPVKAPLKAPLYGIVSAQRLQPAQQEGEAGPVGQAPAEPLTDEDYQPRSRVPLHPQPLQSRPALARRLQEALARPQPSRAPDIRRAVRLLAQGRQITRWPCLARPQEPEQVVVLVDRSLHLRPYWGDQDQLVNVLYQWLGRQGLTTYTVQGDPWQPLACWQRGQVRQPVPALAPPPAGSMVLLLTDRGSLRVDVSDATNAPDARDATGTAAAAPAAHPAGRAGAAAQAAWDRTAQRLGSAGAQVLACPPGGGVAPAGKPRPGSVRPLPAERTARPAPLAHGPQQALLEQLLTLLSCARRIEPELVRALRRLVPALAAQPGLEAQLWSHRAAMDAGYDVCIWQPGAAWPYRRRFEALAPALQQAVLRTLLRVHAVRGRAIEVQELLAWASHVSPGTAEPFAADIAEARQWLARLPLALVNERQNSPDGAAAAATGRATDGQLLAFIQQTHAAQGGDEALVARHADVLGPIWGLAHTAALRQGQQPPSPGALPQHRLAQWAPRPGPAGGGERTWWLAQVDDRLVLSREEVRKGAAPSSRLGQPLTSRSLAWAVQPDGQSQFTQQAKPAHTLARLQPGQHLSLTTDLLQLRMEEIEPPFAYSERGRDQYGLYADLPIQGRDGSVVVQRMRWIEPGRFLMGSPKGEEGRHTSEGPQHWVTITQGLWLADTACTQALWQVVMGKNPSRFHEKNKGGSLHPVEQVSCLDVQSFLAQLQLQLQPGRASLPTEAEWEYACRAGTTTPFSFGSTIVLEQANFGAKKGGTVPVKALMANAWGLYQMHGNVWEWCADEFRRYGEAERTNPGVDEALTLSSERKEAEAQSALRGGSWIDDALIARSAQRARGLRGLRGGSAGFRFVLRSRSQPGGPEAPRRDGAVLAARRSPVLPPEAASRDATAPGTGAGFFSKAQGSVSRKKPKK